MNVRADLNRTTHVLAESFEWQPSPLPGVDRVLLDRVGEEVAVATSIVRYAPGARFDGHKHDLGEEFVVLDGVFSDEHGDYPAGTYIRNPPGTSHVPHSDPGCTIFVKLRQFDDADCSPLTIDLYRTFEGVPEEGRKELFRYGHEVVDCVAVSAGSRFAFPASYHVRELLVLRGVVTWQQEVTRSLGPWSWVRMQPGEPLRVVAQENALLFSKTRPVYRVA